MNRRRFPAPLVALALLASSVVQAEARPNILVAISDDHFWVHTSIWGSAFVETPSLDSVANEGFPFGNPYAV